jgi:hypothetical protein
VLLSERGGGFGAEAWIPGQARDDEVLILLPIFVAVRHEILDLPEQSAPASP